MDQGRLEKVLWKLKGFISLSYVYLFGCTQIVFNTITPERYDLDSWRFLCRLLSCCNGDTWFLFVDLFVCSSVRSFLNKFLGPRYLKNGTIWILEIWYLGYFCDELNTLNHCIRKIVPVYLKQTFRNDSNEMWIIFGASVYLYSKPKKIKWNLFRRFFGTQILFFLLEFDTTLGNSTKNAPFREGKHPAQLVKTLAPGVSYREAWWASEEYKEASDKWTRSRYITRRVFSAAIAFQSWGTHAIRYVSEVWN